MNAVLEDMMRHYINPTQDNWEDLLPLAEFAINNAYNKSIHDTPFHVDYGKHPRTPYSIDTEDSTMQGKNPDAAAKAKFIQENLERLKRDLAAAQQRYKAYADRKTQPMHFDVGQQVLLSSKNIRPKTPGSAKLMPKYIGPFPVMDKVGHQAYRLKLPEHFKIHDVLHVPLLEPYSDNGKYQPPPATVLIEGKPEYQVEQILDTRKRTRRAREYLVQWEGYGSEHNTWEPECNLKNAPDKVQAFWDKKEALGLFIECGPKANVPIQSTV